MLLRFTFVKYKYTSILMIKYLKYTARLLQQSFLFKYVLETLTVFCVFNMIVYFYDLLYSQNKSIVGKIEFHTPTHN